MVRDLPVVRNALENFVGSQLVALAVLLEQVEGKRLVLVCLLAHL